MEKSISVAEAKATLSECIRQVESGSLMLITGMASRLLPLSVPLIWNPLHT